MPFCLIKHFSCLFMTTYMQKNRYVYVHVQVHASTDFRWREANTKTKKK